MRVHCTPLWDGYAILDPNLHSGHELFFTEKNCWTMTQCFYLTNKYVMSLMLTDVQWLLLNSMLEEKITTIYPMFYNIYCSQYSLISITQNYNFDMLATI